MCVMGKTTDIISCPTYAGIRGQQVQSGIMLELQLLFKKSNIIMSIESNMHWLILRAEKAILYEKFLWHLFIVHI